MSDRQIFVHFKLLLRKYDLTQQQMSAPLCRIVWEIHVAHLLSDSHNVCAFSFRNVGATWKKGSVTQSRCYAFNHPYSSEAFDVSAFGFFITYQVPLWLQCCFEETTCRGNRAVCSKYVNY